MNTRYKELYYFNYILLLLFRFFIVTNRQFYEMYKLYECGVNFVFLCSSSFMFGILLKSIEIKIYTFASNKFWSSRSFFDAIENAPL
jgi:hypothetical protein